MLLHEESLFFNVKGLIFRVWRARCGVTCALFHVLQMLFNVEQLLFSVLRRSKPAHLISPGYLRTVIDETSGRQQRPEEATTMQRPIRRFPRIAADSIAYVRILGD